MKTMVYSKKLILLAAMSAGSMFAAQRPTIGCGDTQGGGRWPWALIAAGTAALPVIGIGGKLAWNRWHRVTPSPITPPPSTPATGAPANDSAQLAGCLEELRQKVKSLEEAKHAELGARNERVDISMDLGKAQARITWLEGMVVGLGGRLDREASSSAGAPATVRSRSGSFGGSASGSFDRPRSPGAGDASAGAGSVSGATPGLAGSTPGHPSHAAGGKGAENTGGDTKAA